MSLSPLASGLLPDFDGWRYLAMGALVLVGAFLQGLGGVGFAMFSAPLASLFFPELVPGPLLVLGGAVSALSVLRERRDVDWASVRDALAGRVLGTVAAAGVILILSPRLLAVAFAVMILTGVAFSLMGRTIAATRLNVALAGVASGLMGSITSSGAPPFALVAQHMSPPRMRATMGGIFSVGAVVSLAMLAAVGDFTGAKLMLGIVLSPFMVAGFLASSRVTRVVNVRHTRFILLGLATFGAVGVLVRALWV